MLFSTEIIQIITSFIHNIAELQLFRGKLGFCINLAKLNCMKFKIKSKKTCLVIIKEMAIIFLKNAN